MVWDKVIKIKMSSGKNLSENFVDEVMCQEKLGGKTIISRELIIH